MGKKNVVFGPIKATCIRVWAQSAAVWRDQIPIVDGAVVFVAPIDRKMAAANLERPTSARKTTAAEEYMAICMERRRTRESYVCPVHAITHWDRAKYIVTFRDQHWLPPQVYDAIPEKLLMDADVMAWLLLNKNYENPKQVLKDLCPHRPNLVDLLPPHVDTDVHALSLAYRLLRRRFIHQPTLAQLLHNCELPIARLLYRMSRRGVPYTSHGLRTSELVLRGHLASIKKSIPIENPSSPKQVQAYLYGTLKLTPRIMRLKEAEPTDKNSLQLLSQEHEVVERIIEYRRAHKALTSFVQPYLKRKAPRIHAQLLQTATATGRFSCRSPNLQQLPNDPAWGLNMRNTIRAPPGWRLICADYAQVEIRMLAHFVGPGELQNAFKSSAHKDVYTEMAKQILHRDTITPKERNRAKIVVLGLMYGAGKNIVAQHLGVSIKEADWFSRSFNDAFPEVRAWQRAAIARASNLQYVETIVGRRRFLPNLCTASAPSSFALSEARRQCINTIIQGSAADVLKQAMLRTEHRLRSHAPCLGLSTRHQGREPPCDNGQLILCIHDELLLEACADSVVPVARIVAEEMMGAGEQSGVSVPLEVRVYSGCSWGRLKQVVL